jgi:hypothetical protein
MNWQGGSASCGSMRGMSSRLRSCGRRGGSKLVSDRDGYGYLTPAPENAGLHRASVGAVMPVARQADKLTIRPKFRLLFNAPENRNEFQTISSCSSWGGGGPVDQLDARWRCRGRTRPRRRAGRCHPPAPDNQGRRTDAVDALLEPLVRISWANLRCRPRTTYLICMSI